MISASLLLASTSIASFRFLLPKFVTLLLMANGLKLGLDKGKVPHCLSV